MPSNKDHPVWDVYNELRTARLNVLCYESQLKVLTILNTTIEYLLAILTSSSVAGFWFWKNETGEFIWKLLGVITVILAVGKPILNLGSKIKKKSEIVTAYRELDQGFLHLKIMINQAREYGTSQIKDLQILLKKKEEIVKKYQDIVNDRLKNKCYKRVNEELPIETFYIPEEVQHVK